jgi:hypothetical protein
MKRLASAVQLRPWPPSNKQLTDPSHSNFVPIKPYELKPLDEATFFVDGDDDEGLIVFEKGVSGSVYHYVYRTSGGDITAKKIKSERD